MLVLTLIASAFTVPWAVTEPDPLRIAKPLPVTVALPEIDPDAVLVLIASALTVPVAFTEPDPFLTAYPFALTVALLLMLASPYRMQVFGEFQIGSSNETRICSRDPNWSMLSIVNAPQ